MRKGSPPERCPVCKKPLRKGVWVYYGNTHVRCEERRQRAAERKEREHAQR